MPTVKMPLSVPVSLVTMPGADLGSTNDYGFLLMSIWEAVGCN